MEAETALGADRALGTDSDPKGDRARASDVSVGHVGKRRVFSSAVPKVGTTLVVVSDLGDEFLEWERISFSDIDSAAIPAMRTIP